MQSILNYYIGLKYFFLCYKKTFQLNKIMFFLGISIYLSIYLEERQEYEEVPKLPLPTLQQILDQYLDNLK